MIFIRFSLIVVYLFSAIWGDLMKRIRIALLGAAHDHSTATLETVLKYPDIFEVVSITESNEEVRRTRSSLPAYQHLPWISEEELFSRNDIDAVLCEGDELLALDHVQRCIEKGWHVHMDKPAGTDAAQLEHVLSLAKQKGLVFQMGYMYRYNPAMQYLMQQVKSGSLGDILSIETSMSVCHLPDKREWLGRFQGGMMFFLGCHLIDMIYALAGIPDSITSFFHSAEDSIPVQDNCLSIFDYGNGTATVRVNAAEVNGYDRRQLVVCGTEGTIEIRPLESPTRIYETRKADAEYCPWKDFKHELHLVPMTGRYDAMMLDFAAYILGEKQNPYTYEYELQLQRLILATCGYDIDYRKTIQLGGTDT